MLVPVPTLLTSNLALGPCASSKINVWSDIIKLPVTLIAPVPFGARTISVLFAASSTAVIYSDVLLLPLSIRVQ